MIKCIICNENVTEYVHYTITDKDGNSVTICDYDWQEMSILKKVNGKWVEYAIINGIEYYLKK